MSEKPEKKKPDVVHHTAVAAAPQKPSICRLVVVRRSGGEVINSGATEVPAVVQRVHPDGTIDCCLLTPGVPPENACHVPQEGAGGAPHRYVWSWPAR